MLRNYSYASSPQHSPYKGIFVKTTTERESHPSLYNNDLEIIKANRPANIRETFFRRHKTIQNTHVP